jgi:anti-sigma regulatory factor (Ser/Thr protein kinase)
LAADGRAVTVVSGGDAVIDEASGTRGFSHVALLYATDSDYARVAGGFLLDGIAAGEAVLAAVPPGKISLLHDALGPAARRAEFADMTLLGRNPARIIPRVLAFASEHPGRRVRYLGEPVWPARTGAEVREAATHESLLNLAFAGADAGILCPYDTASLAPDVLSDVTRTHPLLMSGGRVRASAGYAEPPLAPGRRGVPLPPPPAGAARLRYAASLREVRALVAERALAAGLPAARISDLVLAVSEAAGNTLRHARSPGTLSVWQEGREIVCEIRDEGIITDPLAGRRRPGPDAPGGHGLWLVHQLCDLVEIRTGAAVGGTTVRMRMSLP